MIFIAGPCVIESEDQCKRIAERLAIVSDKIGIEIVFKASYDKANRRDGKAFRGPGLVEGLRILCAAKTVSCLRVLTDVHNMCNVYDVADAVDIIQIPAMLCRQTDLIGAAGKSGKIVNIKKGQFINPADIGGAVIKAGNNGNVWITERGSSFGYDRVVVDFVGIQMMKALGVPVIVDISHSVPDRSYSLGLAMAAIGAGVDGLYVEVHEDPDNALCDGKTSMALDCFCDAAVKLNEMSNRLKV